MVGRQKGVTSSVPGWVCARFSTRGLRMGGALGAAGAFRPAVPVGDGSALGARLGLPWRVLAASLLLLVVLGGVLHETLAGGRASVAPAGFRASSHLRAGASAHRKGLSSLPLPAQGPISDALGAESPAYRVRAFRGGFRVASPAQHLSTSFASSGISVSSGSARVGLSLRRRGLRALAASAWRDRPPGEGQPGLLCARRPQRMVCEWAAGPGAGLHDRQGVVCPSRRGAHTLDRTVRQRPGLARPGGQSIEFSRTGRPLLRYSGLIATDARGHALHSWLELHGGRILIRVDAAGARYPLRIDPFIQQGEKLTGGGERGEGGGFGYSVALAPGGEYALVGGPGDSGKAGAAWVFLRSGTTWTQQGKKLTGKEEAGAGEFGESVSISEKGEYALIGAPSDNNRTGAAWVFLRSGTTWAQQGPKLTGGEESGEGYFGYSVAIASKEGNYALIGGPNDSTGVGAAWVFLRSGATWAQQGKKLTGSEASGIADFGYAVALSEKGEYALIGGLADKEGAGAAWVFLRSGTEWKQQGKKLTGGEETGEGEFGESVAISGSGEYALIGGPGDNKEAGAAWVFLRTGTEWKQQGKKLTGSEETGEGQFGFSVAIASAKGEYALIGGPGDNKEAGAAWVFLRSGTTWAQQGKKLTGGGESGQADLGDSVALSSEGTYALVGGWKDNAEVGAAWVFLRSGTTWTQQGEKLTGSGEAHEGESSGKGGFGYSAALSPGGEYALIGGPGDSGKTGAAWIFARSGSEWKQQGKKLTGGEETGAGEFGESVALSTEGNYALIGGPADNGRVGAAWVFLRSGTTWAQQGEKLTGAEESGEGEFGASVAIASKEGNYALIGGPGDNKEVGASWVFLRSGTSWAQQGKKLTGSEESGEGQFGDSVALSAEGTYALAGGLGDKEGAGAAWVFLRSGTTWTQQGKKLTGSEETGEGEFGESVAVSGEGNYALVGGPSDNAKVGAAWVFLRSGTTWAQQGKKLTGSEETGEGQFGYSVAIAAKEGNYALIGGPADNKEVGAAWVFLRSGTEWKQQGKKLTGSGEYGSGDLGDSVALSSEGTYALTGGLKDGVEVGAAWVFMRSGTEWKQQGEKLTGGEEAGEGELKPGKGDFGWSVALSSEGNTALIGGYGYLTSTGAAWVFTRSGSTWTQQAKLIAKSGEEVGPGEFGNARRALLRRQHRVDRRLPRQHESRAPRGCSRARVRPGPSRAKS